MVRIRNVFTYISSFVLLCSTVHFMYRSRLMGSPLILYYNGILKTVPLAGINQIYTLALFLIRNLSENYIIFKISFYS